MRRICRVRPRGFSLLVIALGLAAPARAAAPRARLEYQRLAGAEGCPTEEQLRAAVALRLGSDPFTPSAAERVTIVVAPHEHGWRAQVQLWRGIDAQLGERDLDAASGSCEDFLQNVALAVSIALDPLGARRGPVAPPPPPSAPPPPPPQVVAAPPPPAPPVAAPARTPWGLQAEIGALGAVGAAPSANAGFAVQVDARWPHFSLGLGGRSDLPASLGYGPGTGSVSTSLVVGEVVPCARQGPFAECVVLAAGSQTAQANDLPGATQGTAFYFAVGPRLLAEFPLGWRLFGQVAAEGLAPVTRTNVNWNGQTVWSTNPIAGDLSLSLLLKFL